MRRCCVAALLLCGGLHLVSCGGKDAAPASCVEAGEEDDDVLDEENHCYWEWCDEQERVDEQERESRAAGCSSSADPAPLTVRAGRPPAIGNEVDVDELARLAFQPGVTIAQMAAHLGVSVDVVKKSKQKHGLTHLQPAPELPPLAILEEQWAEYPATSVEALAEHMGVSVRTLRRHFEQVGFRPKDQQLPDATVIAALQAIREGGWCAHLGVTFAEARLRTEFGLVVRPHQIQRCLKVVDPDGHTARRQAAIKTKYAYDVAGPRSLYHMDAHEKLAKIWGFWFHLLIDGYSRFIVYLSVRADKKAETVRSIFVAACDSVGWASRLRCDRGRENGGAVAEQINHWWDHTASDDWNRNRGSALTGRSTQNCRAEYVWAHLVKQVVHYFRELFFDMQRDMQILDPSLATDLFCLHAVYLPLIQAAADTFREMWNARRIRGPRTVRGRGGGIPAELFSDPVGSGSVRDADDNQYYANPSLFGVDDEFKGDTEELQSDAAFLADPMDGLNEMFLRTRAAYFEQWPMDPSADGVLDYIRFKTVSFDLVLLSTMRAPDGNLDLHAWVESADVQDAAERAERKALREQLVDAVLSLD